MIVRIVRLLERGGICLSYLLCSNITPRARQSTMPAVLDPLYLTIDLSRTTFDTILVDKTRRDLLDPYCPPSGICQTAKDVLRAGVWMLEGALHDGMQAVHRLMGDATAQQLMRHNASPCTPVTQDRTTSLLAPLTIHEEKTERLVITMALKKTIVACVSIELDTITVLLAKFVPRTRQSSNSILYDATSSSSSRILRIWTI